MSLNQHDLVLIKKKQRSDWVSCQSITENLYQLYSNHYGKSHIKVFTVEPEQNPYQLYQIAKEILKVKPKKIVWVDHQPHPHELIRIIHGLIEKSLTRLEYPQLLFHLFGDFTLQAPQWLSIHEILKNFSVKFLVASHAQKGLLDHFLAPTDRSTVLPFPVNETAFYFSEIERQEFRQKHQIEDQTPALLYTGRLSRQKNIIELIQNFLAIKAHLPSGTKLFIAGDFDDLNIPFLGLTGKLGSFQKNWLKVMPSHSTGEIVYLGNLDSEMLRMAYNGCDLFCSMSTHNDEDFGMSPAEAAMTGMPLLLSRWGGYQSFKEYLKDSCNLVEIDDALLRLSPRSIDLQKKILFSLQSLPLSDAERHNQMALAQKSLSLTNLTKELSVADESRGHEKFSGFLYELDKLANAFTMNPRAPFRDKRGGFNEHYFKVYQAYFNAPGLK